MILFLKCAPGTMDTPCIPNDGYAMHTANDGYAMHTELMHKLRIRGYINYGYQAYMIYGYRPLRDRSSHSNSFSPTDQNHAWTLSQRILSIQRSNRIPHDVELFLLPDKEDMRSREQNNVEHPLANALVELARPRLKNNEPG